MVLTNRELEVLHFLADNRSNKEIAVALDITEGTVKIHVHHILSKLDAESRVEAIARAQKRRLLPA